MNVYSDDKCAERDYPGEIRKRLTAAREYMFTRGWQESPPNFRSMRQAADRLLDQFDSAETVLSMRYAALRVLRERVLERKLRLVVPGKDGQSIHRIPASTLFNADETRNGETLKISPIPRGSVQYAGHVDLVVAGCQAFDARRGMAYLFDLEQAAGFMEMWSEGLRNGFRLPDGVPVAALAHDLQEVDDWPRWRQALIDIDYIVTPTRILTMGHDKQEDGDRDEG